MKHVLFALMTLILPVAVHAAATSDAAAAAVMKAVNGRADSDRQQSRLQFTLTPKSGSAQVREAIAYRMRDGQSRRLAIRFEAPAAIRGSAFLAWDAGDAAVADDQWLYLPALRRARRIPGRERGSYFLGTDLTYDDIRSFGRIEVAEYRLGAPQPVPGQTAQVEIEGEPVGDELKKELGYGRLRWRVDTATSVVLRSEHWDVQGAPLKTVEYLDLQQLEGIWVPTHIRVENLRNGHRTELRFSDIANRPTFDPVLLTPAGLERGG